MGGLINYFRSQTKTQLKVKKQSILSNIKKDVKTSFLEKSYSLNASIRGAGYDVLLA